MKYQNAFIYCTLHILVFSTIYLILQKFGFLTSVPGDKNLINWDSVWFKSIKDSGYFFNLGKNSNLAFFPFFPYVWKILSISPMWISFVNLLLFVSSFSYLVYTYKPQGQLILFILSSASFIFFGVPYSEATFFFFSVFILVGYHRSNPFLICVGLFGASLVKPISIIFIAAIFIKEMLSNDKRSIGRPAFYITSTFLGYLIANLIQYRDTDKLFYSIKVQEFWGRSWIMPGFPTSTTFPNRTLGIDSIALTLGIASICFCFGWFVIYIRKTKFPFNKGVFPDSSVVFSALVISALAILDVCFTSKIHGASNIWSINRHILCTPFAVVFLIWVVDKFDLKNQDFYLFFGIFCLFVTGIYKVNTQFLHFVIFFYSLFLIMRKEMSSYIFIPIYLFNVIVQAYTYEDFLNGLWIG